MHPATPVLRQPSTTEWLLRAAEDPVARHPKHLPQTLDFREHADLFLRTYHGALSGTELGFPLVLDGARLHFPMELASQARYGAFTGGGRFIGTFHVHPPEREAEGRVPAPFFDPQDLASTLRSDYAGFIELLLAADRLYALVRANPYLYISAHHVNRNPLLLAEEHGRRLHRQGARSPEEPGFAEHYRKASLYWFQRYHMALYEGDPGAPLQRTVTPEAAW
jgi:hypothetical protein